MKKIEEVIFNLTLILVGAYIGWLIRGDILTGEKISGEKKFESGIQVMGAIKPPADSVLYDFSTLTIDTFPIGMDTSEYPYRRDQILLEQIQKLEKQIKELK